VLRPCVPYGPLGLHARRVRARAALLLLVGLPSFALALEPRFDHRDQQGATVEAVFARDTIWRGSSEVSNGLRGGLRLAWSFDPTGDGDEIFVGGTLTALGGTSLGTDRVRWTVDARYRVTLGTEELKTLLEVGLWGTSQDRLSLGPIVGLGLMYDFSRNFGLMSSVFLAAGAGQSRAVSVGGGLGAQLRFD
jgi:hypothetical protein